MVTEEISCQKANVTAIDVKKKLKRIETRIETQINKKGESPNRKKEIKVQIEKGK